MREIIYTLAFGALAILFLHWVFDDADQEALRLCETKQDIETCRWVFN